MNGLPSTPGSELGGVQAELAEARAELAASRAALRALVERHIDGMVLVDGEGVVRIANPAANALFGQDLVGRPFGFPVVAGEHVEIDVVRPGAPALAEMRVAETSWGGEPALLVALRDISARRRAEEALRRKEERLRQAQRVEAVGLLAAEVAHHMNNVLMGVAGCARAALGNLEEEAPAYRFVREIQRSTEQGATLMRRLVAFSRQRAHHPEVIDVNAVVADCTALLRRLVGDDIALETTLEPAAWRVVADAGQLEQVLMTLVVNARDAMPEGGSITIETRNAPAGQGGSAGEHVVLVVRDTGSGMDEATQARIFEPLFTTKEGMGTGLGLPTAQAIIEESGGQVVVESALGRGTTVTLRLPRARPVAAAPRLVAAPPHATGDETVLLVDDEESIRMALRHTLESGGYRVIDAGGGVDALALAEQHDGPIHALVTDLRMPGMNGVELARSLSAQRPGIRIIYMTAYAGGTRTRKRLRSESAALLEKPFPPDDLLRRLREVLDAEAPAAPAAAPAEGTSAPKARTLLIVEDQAATRIALARLLRGEGRRILEAATGADALRLCREGAGSVDVLLADVVLSDTTGVALARELQGACPGLSVIYMSGHPRDTLEERFALPPGVALLEKPVDFDELERLIEEALKR